MAFSQTRSATITRRRAPSFEYLVNETIRLRLVILALALAILYVRTPITFTHPQFRVEDVYWFRLSRLDGLASFQISASYAGYLCSAQVIVALLANLLNPAFAAAIYCYTAIFLTLTVVWLATSPRLDIPCKPLLGLAVVLVPMGYEVLGSLDYIQWILPVGVFALLFMRAARSNIVLAGEALLTGVTAATGPFSLYLAPLFLWQAVRAMPGLDRRRMIILTVINGAGAMIQFKIMGIAQIITGLAAPPPPAFPHFPWTLWVNTPFLKWMTDFGHFSRYFKGMRGACLALALSAIALCLACIKPYRTQKLFILFFAAIIALSGMYRVRIILDVLAFGTTGRYFYVGSVLILWFICCLTSWRPLRVPLTVFIAVAELLMLPAVAGTPLTTVDLQWPVWGRYVASGVPVIIPSTPVGWFAGMPAAKTGPLARFAAWEGQPIARMAIFAPQPACLGTIGPAEPAVVTNAGESPVSGLQPSGDLWTIAGWAWDQTTNKPPELILLVDASGQIAAFGYAGFRQSGARRFSDAGWQSIFYAPSGSMLRAYAVLNSGAICALPGVQYLPINQPLISPQFVEGVPIMPGTPIVQRFKPARTLHGISVRFIDWALTPSNYEISWRVDARFNGKPVELGSGQIAAETVVDWGRIDLPMTAPPDSVPDEVDVTVWTNAKSVTTRPAGLPLFLPSSTDNDPPAEIGGVTAPKSSQLDLSVAYN